MLLDSGIVSFFGHQWPLIVIPVLLWSAISVIIRIREAMKSPLPGPKLAKYTAWWMRLKSISDPNFSVQTIYLLHKKYGPIVQVAPKQISFCHADALKGIYAGPRGLDSSADLTIFQQFGSPNLVSTTEANLHRARRNHVAGLYSGPSVTTPAVKEILKTFLDRFMKGLEEDAARSPSRTVNIFPWIKWLTSDVMIQLVFGSKNPPDLLRNETSRKKLQALITTSTGGGNFDGLYEILLFWFPNLRPRIPSFLESRPKINKFGMKRVKEEFESQESSASDLKPTHLQHLLSIYRGKGPSPAIPDAKYIASDCMDHFFAGSETTTDLMAASIWRLSLPENKAHQERLRQELRDAGVYPETHADLSLVQKLPFLTNVLRETLRLDSPIPADLPRVVKKGQDVTIMGVKIEPGTRISTPIYSLHRDPQVFADPETWNPDRWAFPVSSLEYKQMLRNFIPFGTGARMCTGMNVAWAETRLLLARIYSTYETQLDRIWLRDGALLPEEMRKELYPATVKEPIEFRRLSGDSKGSE